MTRGCLRGTQGMWCGRSLDLADHMFGGLVTTGLAKDILEQFLADGTVTCEDNNPGDANATSHALNAAYADAVADACIRPDTQPDKPTPEPKTRYRTADSALSTARSILKDDLLQAKNRFAAPVDKHPPSYGPDGEDMRPDFMVLPLTTFNNDPELEVHDAYVSFTGILLTEESKSARNARDGLIRVQRYMRGIKRAQPRLRFATGMTVGKDFVVLSRGDCSGLERIEISLTDGRGCIEFVRIILSIVLADNKAFGHNTEIDICKKDVRMDTPELCSLRVKLSTTPPTFGGYCSSKPGNHPSSVSSNLPSVDQHSATSSTGTTSDNTETGSKRGPDDQMSPGKLSKKRKRTLVFHAFVPAQVYGRERTGIFFTSACIRGRGTAVYVVGADDGKAYSALKTSSQDVACAGGQAAALEKLSGHKPRPDVIIPVKLSNPVAKDRRMNSTLGSIRGFLGDEIQKLTVENRILTVTTSNLQRPVAYFWSPHDFVRGLIGALLGHEYLCEIGILHCDISENNIVLSLCRGGFGALIDSHMAIVGRPNMHRDYTPLPEKSVREVTDELVASIYRPPAPLPASDEQYKAQRTGTTPYMSIRVLNGKPHTHFDDIESFLYVLVLVFLSYKGPLKVDKLREARVQGFIQPVGMGRLPHVTTWPAMIGRWRSGTFTEMSQHKTAILSAEHRRRFMKDYLRNIRARWEDVSQSTPPAVSDLVYDCWMMFSRRDCKVTHSQFVEVLQAWLTQYEGEENKYVYPFE
ncbi:hypothetical protein EDD15DRAFT_1733763 [Pisolithus albus]|nr:hypothetical protein EDD15DRAFT_1733763 [Pisolithus albus]